MCDVYSFGVVLLELPSGRPIDVRDNGKTRMLSLLKQIYLLDNRRLYKIMDTKLDGQYPQKVALTVATLALQCLSDGPKDGPEYGRGFSHSGTTLKSIQDKNKNKIKPPFCHHIRNSIIGQD